jgi:hypothetical protein
MILNRIIGLGAIFALYWIYHTRKLIPSIISGGMIIGVLLVLLPRNVMITPGLSIYIVFVVFAFLYGLLKKGLTVWPRIIICTMSLSIIAYWLWRLNHLHGMELLLPVLSLIVGVSALISKAKLKNEAGFLVILAADAVAIIVENLMRMS